MNPGVLPLVKKCGGLDAIGLGVLIELEEIDG